MGFVAYQVINSRSSEDTRGKEVEGVQHLVNMGQKQFQNVGENKKIGKIQLVQQKLTVLKETPTNTIAQDKEKQ